MPPLFPWQAKASAYTALCPSVTRQAGGHTAGWHRRSFVCLLLQTVSFHDAFSFSVNGFYFCFKAESILSCSAFFLRLCLWSRIDLGSKMVLEKETAFPDFCILHLSSQLPKGPLSWPTAALLDGKHICFNPPSPSISWWIYLHIFDFTPSSEKCLFHMRRESLAKCLAQRQHPPWLLIQQILCLTAVFGGSPASAWLQQ